ncbi:MAG TPA: hypothetical protein VNX25_10355, partial [Verrucomicrobiae bacterium]|nr:hypothetical protein [Verrucomicrobiae bacterium]
KEVADRTLHDRKSREEVVRALSAARHKPACCWQKLQEVSVTAGDSSAQLKGKFGIEGEAGGIEYQTRKVKLVLEEGVWKLSLHDLLALAGGKKGKRRK